MKRLQMRHAAVPLGAVFAVALAAPVPTRADVFGPISLVSESATEQAVYTYDPAISGDGRYVAFDGYFDGLTGVWRRNLQIGDIEPVAVGEPGTPAGSAELPSINQDGRYISFTTTAKLSPEDTNNGPDVYVRDMEPHEGEPLYELASAVNGSTQGLAYRYGSNSSFEETHFGSVASGRSALSGDGRRVVFVTTAVSNLANPNRPRSPGGPEAPATPALQVAVRDLDTERTELVSVQYDPATGKPRLHQATEQTEPVSVTEGNITFGAVYMVGTGPPPFGQIGSYPSPPVVGASISADGSTVAWLGVDIGEQVPLLTGESRQPKYTEPLWRRIADGPRSPTRRITGGSDPTNSACIASGETSLPQPASLSDPCQGPFATFVASSSPGTWTGGTGDVVPRLSGDGYTVAFLASAPLVSFGANFGGGAENSDLYLANMHEGLTRYQALRSLTELAGGDSTDLATTAPIVDFGISPDGIHVAFTTKRTQFPLGSPAYVSAPAAIPGMLELFDVDLADDTLTRVTHGFEGNASEHPHAAVTTGQDPYLKPADGVLSPSFSDDGDTLAFSSTASNLVYGDGNTPAVGDERLDGSDAFLVSRELFSSTPVSQTVSSAPALPSLTPSWRLDVTALLRPDGSVELYVEVPGAGKLRARASGVVVIRSDSAHPAARHSRTSASRRGQGRTRTLATRTVAVAGSYPRRDGLLALSLKLAKPYASLASARGGLSASVNLLFTASGHPDLRQNIAVVFLRTEKPRSSRRRASRTSRGR